MKKRVLLLTTLGVLSAACFVGCGGKKATPQTMEELTAAMTEKGEVTYHSYKATVDLDVDAEIEGETLTFGDTVSVEASIGDAGEMYVDLSNSNLNIGGTAALELEANIPGYADIKRLLNTAQVKMYLPTRSDVYIASPTLFSDGEMVYHIEAPQEYEAEIPTLEPTDTTSICEMMTKYGTCDFSNVTDYYVVEMPINDAMIAEMKATSEESQEIDAEVEDLLKQCSLEVKISAADFSLASFSVSGSDISMEQDGNTITVSFTASIAPSEAALTLDTKNATDLTSLNEMQLMNTLNADLLGVVMNVMMNFSEY
ncbi:MAG: hypothetical protein MJ105_05760 [Lachnospiraceae bacterium]|nr:hypothetical protein [Lachnospiraceae bacterium]